MRTAIHFVLLIEHTKYIFIPKLKSRKERVQKQVDRN